MLALTDYSLIQVLKCKVYIKISLHTVWPIGQNRQLAYTLF